MLKLYAVKMSAGNVCLMRVLGGVNPQDEINKWPGTAPQEVVSFREVSESEVPQDRYFRDAWEDDGSSVFVDMSKARNIHMNKIRIERDKKLADLDKETLKGNDVQAEKQALRDLPQTFDLSIAATPEELKALWPSEL